MRARLDHVAVAVADLDGALARFRSLWDVEPAGRERVDEQGVEEAMLPLGESALQLVSSTGTDTAVGRFLERRGEGLHHIALEVDDLVGALERLRAEGVRLIDETPRAGGGGRLIAFVHPEALHGVLVELIQR